MAQSYDLTKGRETPLILKFFFPLFMTNLLQQFYSIADTAIVGKGLGDDALAAVGNMSSLSFLIVGFSVGLSNGFSVSIAQKYGAGAYERLRKCVASTIKLSLFIAILLTILSNVFLSRLLLLLQTDSSIMADGLLYGHIIFGGLIVTIAYNVCASILRALGDSKTPFFAIVASTIINLVLNCVFIFILGSGVEGAAAATVFSQVISTLVCLRKIRRIEIIRLTRADFATDLRMYGELFSNGLPMALMNSITAVGCMVVQYFVNGLGVAYTSAYSACSKYINLFMQPGCTAGITMSSFTGQNYGAGKYHRIRRGLFACLGIAFTFYMIAGAVMVLFPTQLAGLMLNGADSIALAVQFLPVCGTMMIIVDFLFVFRSGVQAMGNPLIPMISGIGEMIMRIAVILFFIPRVGFMATAYAEIAAWSIAFLLNFTAFWVILGRKMKVSENNRVNNPWANHFKKSIKNLRKRKIKTI